VETFSDRTQRTYIRLFLGGIVGFILFIALCWGGWRAYTSFESRHLTRRGAAHLGGNDLRQATLSAARAIQLDPKNTDALRLMGRISEAGNDRGAVEWRRKALELEPNSPPDFLAFVEAAARFNEIAAADNAMERAAPSMRETAEFHVAAARLAEAKKDFAKADEEWTKAVTLAPNNNTYQLQYGISLLRADDTSKHEKGLSILQNLRSDEKQRSAATRALLADAALRHQNSEKLADLARELQEYPEATFTDRILYADVLRQLRDPKFAEYLTKIEQVAANKTADLASLITWLRGSGMSLVAIDYARTLPPEQLSKWPVCLAMAESYTKVGDWNRLENEINNQQWGRYEFLRHAYLALASRKQGKGTVADREWSAAEKAAGSQPDLLSALARAATDWGWQNEAVRALWTLADQPASKFDALQSLYQRYIEAQDTPGLYRVLTRLVELKPDDMAIQNNFAQVGLLLNVDIGRVNRVAEEVYRKDPMNPAYAATYAFALYTRRDAQGALRIMDKLDAAKLNEPSIATYYGIFLASLGDKERAAQYLEKAESAKLLPEEKDLVAKAKLNLK
jgi:cytochrome c-type biogenesis protein CcmH/NrfG